MSGQKPAEDADGGLCRNEEIRDATADVANTDLEGVEIGVGVE